MQDFSDLEDQCSPEWEHWEMLVHCNLADVLAVLNLTELKMN